MTGYSNLQVNFSTNITHAGLIYYMHLCWAQEKGACLRPDMIWHTIVGEIAHEVLQEPEYYRYLFTDSKDKQTVVQVVDDTTEISVELLVEQINHLIKNKEFLSVICDTQEFLSVICDTRFKSEVANSNIAINMAFACMSTPFFNYMTRMCGIPFVEIKGGNEDWLALYHAISKLI